MTNVTVTNLVTTTGLEARIFQLAEREPFITSGDLAEAYGSTVKRINQAVKRNPDRFPGDFCFELTESEIGFLRSQNVTANDKSVHSVKARYAPLVFTHAGAMMLSSVLKTPVAAQVSVIIHRAFAEMEQQALRDVQNTLLKLQTEVMARKPSRTMVVQMVKSGWDFHTIWKNIALSRARLADLIRELALLELIEALPEGTPPPERRAQHDLFKES